ncbi:MAG: tRNA (adenosine(37)-N6)-threonylcarbamoyltransferase complex dimerization subunit type 1 TsaB [Marinoscillum sp.]|uniref:tRNA (adenosine(37)-N6)-threonylcarbamoyltransferase complex dimerization subunit type 1 TsaB n=1 Tax=Marinoscillum sp. TaxID=2024838 RepID=UPI00330226F7
MSTILSLDTSTKVCSVAIHQEGVLIGHQAYHLQKSHSNLLPGIIQQLAENCEVSLSGLTAIALSAGPGSYTGLRIGTATAKGLAYTLSIPFIALDTLDAMIAQVAPMLKGEGLLCPMIDARRMEVYCKVVSHSGDEIWKTQPLIVDEHSFDDLPQERIYFFGNGSNKLEELFGGNEKCHFIGDIHPSAAHMGEMAWAKFQDSAFEDIAYFEPEYLKEYRTNVPSQKFKV